MNRWLLIGLLAASAFADSPRVDVPVAPPTLPEEKASAPAPSQEPISTSVKDPTDKRWKEYDNRIVKAHLRLNVAWSIMEVKETQSVGSLNVTVAREVGVPVTLAITRGPLGGPFESWISSESLKQLYPSGYKSSPAILAGRQATLIKGIAPDGRYDESYFIAHQGDIYQVSCSAPKESWKEYEPTFAALKKSLRWLP